MAAEMLFATLHQRVDRFGGVILELEVDHVAQVVRLLFAGVRRGLHPDAAGDEAGQREPNGDIPHENLLDERGKSILFYERAKAQGWPSLGFPEHYPIDNDFSLSPATCRSMT